MTPAQRKQSSSAIPIVRSSRRLSMSRRLALTALASALILSTADLSSASAFGHGGGAGLHGGLRGGALHGGGIHTPGGYFGARIPRGPGHPIVPLPVRGPGHPVIPVPVRGPGKPPVVIGWPGWKSSPSLASRILLGGRQIHLCHRSWRCLHPSCCGTCSCLTKSYLQDGTVVFADQCTNESATAAPAAAAPNG